MKLCINCKHKRSNYGSPLCKSPNAPFKINEVYGNIEPNFCSTMRKFDGCGLDAKWFKQRKFLDYLFRR